MPKARAARPKRDRPQLPDGYISRAAKGMLGWDDAERILAGGRFYWIATTSADRRPHLVQQWGAWVDGHFYFEGSEATRWARNLAREPRIGFGTMVGTRAVMCDGTADVIRGVARDLAVKIARQYATKYGRTFDYRPKPEGYEKGHVFRVRPRKVVLFDVKEFATAATRFTFA
jgi:nitroimidazol reductase NimA-like FMN-containing flavoprotein (pyridoxamine 5'-phosphate oxidase superfamily)